jgi:hypothetical protein
MSNGEGGMTTAEMYEHIRHILGRFRVAHDAKFHERDIVLRHPTQDQVVAITQYCLRADHWYTRTGVRVTVKPRDGRQNVTIQIRPA